MKQRKPLRRHRPLRARTRLRSKTELKRTELKPGKPLAPGKPLQRGRWSRASWEQQNKIDREAHQAWKRGVVLKRCERCLIERLPIDRRRQRDAHHILPARYIRRYVRSLKLPSEEARVLLRSLLNDRRNAMCLCRACHDRHENAYSRIPRSMISEKALQFARELGMEHIIERLYPA